MKKLYTLLLFLALSFSIHSQKLVKTEIIDSYSNKIRPLFSSKGTLLKMSLIRTTDSTTINTVTIIEIATETTETVATSTTFAFGSSGAWGLGGTQINQSVKETGKRVLMANDLVRLISLFNNLIQLTGGEKPSVETLWKYDFDSGFSIALSFKPYDRLAPYSYILSMDGAVFEIDSANSLAMLKKLAVFRDGMTKK